MVKTTANHTGVTIHLEKDPREIILFCDIDLRKSCDSAIACKIDGQRCDIVIVYKRDVESEVKVCLIDLKHSNPENAKSQIQNTLKSLFDLRILSPDTDIYPISFSRKSAPRIREKGKFTISIGKKSYQLLHLKDSSQLADLLRR